MVEIKHGEALAELRAIDCNSVDSVVTDPPYGLSFMGKRWDSSLPGVEVWNECLRILKPGGYLLAFSSPRTYHRLAVNIEDAGFDIRDQIMWLRGDQFPKSKTALKTAHEPICMARKPFKGSEAANVAQHGTGALNIDSGRIGSRAEKPQISGKGKHRLCYGLVKEGERKVYDQGRWPTNVLHDGCLEGKPYESFFYCARASTTERGIYNTHTTVKPLLLMRYLVCLVTPEGGLVLDPFVGSGTTACACVQEGYSCIGIEREAEYIEIANKRLAQEINGRNLCSITDNRHPEPTV